jgi:hypothetical protein
VRYSASFEKRCEKAAGFRSRKNADEAFAALQREDRDESNIGSAGEPNSRAKLSFT